MIRLKTKARAEKLRGNFPDIVFEHIELADLIIWLRSDENLTDIPELGKEGLQGIIDNEWIGIEKVAIHNNNQSRIYEIMIVLDSATTIILFLEDSPSLDDRLRLALEIQAS